jgi:rhodanese-related sulfurtransferase
MEIENISPADAARAAESGTLQIVDIRLAPDASADRIDRALNIPFPELARRFGEIDRSRPVAFLCKAGAKSQDAARMAAERGYDALNVDGGALAWNEQAREPVEPVARGVALQRLSD